MAQQAGQMEESLRYLRSGFFSQAVMIPSYHFGAFALMLERENVDAFC
jgi:hypothetical protein